MPYPRRYSLLGAATIGNVTIFQHGGTTETFTSGEVTFYSYVVTPKDLRRDNMTIGSITLSMEIKFTTGTGNKRFRVYLDSVAQNADDANNLISILTQLTYQYRIQISDLNISHTIALALAGSVNDVATVNNFQIIGHAIT